jgi:dipeptidyl aminopeptidase/acylaminoacyl peptidase
LWDDAGQVRAHAINAHGDLLSSLLTSNLDADLYLVPAAEERSAVLQVDDESWISDATFAPDGASALVLTNADSDHVRLISIDLKTHANEVLLDESGHDIEIFAVSPDGRRLVWSVNADGYSVVRCAELHRLADAVTVDLPAGVADRISWAPSGEEFAVGWTPTMTPARIFRVNVEGSAEPMFASEPDDAAFIGKSPELIEFETFDGKMIPAFWFPSEDTEAPVIIDVHGGPEGQRRPGFHPVLQHLAASGFHVLTTNVRGSTGYGKAWSHLDDVELRMDSVRDLAHAHAWIVNHLSGSESRIGIMGQSYGGFMTLSAITEYPDLWFAAVDVVGISNFVTFLERTGPWRRRHREAEYGSLEHNRDFLEAISPIRKVDEIAAPLLVIHGRNDPRVPLHETEQLIASLEQRNHPVESLVFDDEGHGLSKRPNRTTAYAAVADFFWNARNLSDSKP